MQHDRANSGKAINRRQGIFLSALEGLNWPNKRAAVSQLVADADIADSLRDQIELYVRTPICAKISA